MKAVAVLLFALLVACCQAGLVLYSAGAVENIEIEEPVIKINQKIVTDEDEISTTEIKPSAAQYGYPAAAPWSPYQYSFTI